MISQRSESVATFKHLNPFSDDHLGFRFADINTSGVTINPIGHPVLQVIYGKGSRARRIFARIRQKHVFSSLREFGLPNARGGRFCLFRALESKQRRSYRRSVRRSQRAVRFRLEFRRVSATFEQCTI
jgi:hypothetical protein